MNDPQTFNRQVRSFYVFIVLVVFILQRSCNRTNVVSSTPAAATTTLSITNATMPTKTILPSETPSPAPEVTGTWSEEPSMLFARSAHAVVSSDSAIYALAGTDEHGKPVLDVEAFDGRQWKTKTTLPGGGLN